MIKSADWIIDLGPEGGDQGGSIVVQGTPEEVAAHPGSFTGHFLQEILADSHVAPTPAKRGEGGRLVVRASP